jgi:hypothetical protein
MEVCFRFGGRNGPDRLEQAAIVEPVDPFQRCVFHRLEAAPWTATIDDLGFEKPVDRLGQRLVMAVADGERGPWPRWGRVSP